MLEVLLNIDVSDLDERIGEGRIVGDQPLVHIEDVHARPIPDLSLTYCP
jgi:hypothetical protein